MTDSKSRRFGPLSLLLGLVALGAVFGLWYSTEPALHADKTPPAGDGIVASVGGVQISEADLEEANAEGFLQIQRDRHELLEATLNGVIQEKLLELEATEQGIDIDALTQKEIEAKITEPTDAEVDAFYEENKARLNQPKESLVPQIRQHLAGQSRMGAFNDYIKGLRAKYEVETFLQPMRFEIEAAGYPAKGPEGAPVTIVEFSDFECPYCSRINPTLDKIEEEYGDKVRLVFRQFPLHQIHPNAQKAAEASLCAFDQEKFWEMHDTMFEEQKALSVEQLKQKAERLGLETETFNECLDSGKYAEQVYKDVEEGRLAGVTGTPAMFINGRFLSGAQPFEAISVVIDDELSRGGE